MPPETDTSPEHESLAQFDGEVFMTEKVDGKTVYYCKLCKAGPFQGSHGFKIHLGVRHRTTAERALRRRFIKELRRAEQTGVLP